MAIKLTPQYNSYINECTKKLTEDTPLIKRLKARKLELLNCISEYEEIINDFGSFNYNDLKHYIESDLKNFEFIGYTNTDVLVIINEISKVNTLLRAAIKKIQPYRIDNMSFAAYKEIIKIYNLTILDHMIFDAYKWNLGFNVGNFQIIAKDNIPRVNSIGELEFAVDWGTSMKNRSVLINEGADLYSIYNQDGVKWKAFFTQESKFHIRWFNKKSKLFIKNASVYRFIPVRGMYEPYRKIYQANNEDSLLINKYQYFKYGNKYREFKSNS